MSDSVYDIFAQKNIVYVDDSKSDIAKFSPALMKIRQATCSTIHHFRQSMADLVKDILDKKPDIVILDGTLSKNIFGYELIRPLKESDSTIICIGFSFDTRFPNKFENEGANGFIKKILADDHLVESLLTIIQRIKESKNAQNAFYDLS